MTNDTPVISVLMPVYNCGPFLAEAVESVLGQTFRDFELIAVNDGSTDNSLQILEDFARQDSRVKVISRPNTGLVEALNDCLVRARGEFIARMDGDDVCLPERFQRQVDYLREHPEVVGLGCRCLFVDAHGDPFHVGGLLTSHDEIERQSLGGNASTLIHPSTMFPRKLVQELGGYRDEIEYCEDLDLYLRLAEVGKLTNLPEVLLKFRRHERSTTAQRSADRRDWFTRAVITEARKKRGLEIAEPDARWVFNTPLKRKRRRATQAWKGGFPKTARKYAWQVLRLAPWQRDTWTLLWRVLVLSPPTTAEPGTTTNSERRASTDALTAD